MTYQKCFNVIILVVPPKIPKVILPLCNLNVILPLLTATIDDKIRFQHKKTIFHYITRGIIYDNIYSHNTELALFFLVEVYFILCIY